MESATPEAQPPEAQTRPTPYRYWLFLLAFIVGAALIVNHSLARHQSLFLVNGLSTPATVLIDGGRPEPLSPRTWHKVDFLVPLAEAKAANPEELLACAERHLLADPGNDALVRTYTILAETLKEGARCKDFLAKRLMRTLPDQSQ